MLPLDPVNLLYCILVWYIYTIYFSGKLGPGGEYTLKLKMVMTLFLAHLSRRLTGELIVYKGIRRPSVGRPSVRRPSTFSNDISSEAVRRILSILHI